MENSANMEGSEVIAPVKDGEFERPIPHAWRDALTSIVRALAGGDYSLASLPDRFILAGGFWQTLAKVFNWSTNMDACRTGCLQR